MHDSPYQDLMMTIMLVHACVVAFCRQHSLWLRSRYLFFVELVHSIQEEYFSCLASSPVCRPFHPLRPRSSNGRVAYSKKVYNQFNCLSSAKEICARSLNLKGCFFFSSRCLPFCSKLQLSATCRPKPCSEHIVGKEELPQGS